MLEKAKSIAVFAAVAGLIAAAAILTYQLRPRSTAVPAARPLASGADNPRVESGHSIAVDTHSSNKATPAHALSLDYRKAFQQSHNYLELAYQLLPAANEGDKDAQFYLSELLERCERDSRMFLQRRGRQLTLEESLQWAGQRHLPLELAQLAFDRCHDLDESGPNEFGSAPAWLGKATLAGQPLAEAATAAKLLLQRGIDNVTRAGGVPQPLTIAPETANMDPRQLLRAAVESNDPQVLFSIGEATEMLHLSDPGDSSLTYAWWLVACERGMDCSPTAEWVQNTCYLNPQCASASSPEELIRLFSGDSWPTVQQRAEEINSKLAAGNWNDLGLGSK